MDENNLTILLQQGDRNAYKQLFIKYYSPPLANMHPNIFLMMILKSLCRS